MNRPARHWKWLLWILCVAVAGGLPSSAAATEDGAYTAVTAQNPEISLAEFGFLLEPLTRAELEVEAQAWLALLQQKVRQISDTEIAVIYKRQEIEAAEETAEAVDDVIEAVEDADAAAVEEAAADVVAAAEAAAEAEQKTQEHEGAKAAEEAAADDAAEESGDVPVDAAEEAPAITEDVLADTEQLEAAAEAAEQVVEAKAEIKAEILEDLVVLRDQRTALIVRTNLVLDELEAKGGDVTEHRLYVAAVSGIRVDVSDWQAAWATIVGWLKSGEGGIKWAKNILAFLATLLAFWILALIVGRLTERAMGMSKRLSSLIRDFVGKSVRRVVLLVGFVVALGALGVKMGPVLAVIGAAGFVVAFALQDSLGNLASGIMILIYRPFDVGDAVDVAGVAGKVRSMNLVSTTITTFDNKVVVVPNNKIWGDIITNITGSTQRRVDMMFGIGYEADIAKAQAILERIVAEHPLVLKDPEPVIKVHELADSSVNFICRPWSKTSDYWDVFWDVTRAVKEQFDREGVSIPFPQQDIHVRHITSPPAAAEATT
ncbi:MAG: mechanosensitive ion channel family protein [Planctomycetota bacterium]|jgi:small conductance mechanosensitive channel